ncbi:MAG: YjdF family protein [Ruminococcus sp.]|nr:YjdF family protein [Ruminococcus sp.]
MSRHVGTLNVFFDGQFWTGVFENTNDGKLSVCKVIFGAEPKDCEIYEFILKNYHKLKFSPEIEISEKMTAKNPKRIQREAKKQLQTVGIGTKSQQALKLQHEQMKTERRIISRERNEAEKRRIYEMKQSKRKEKHKGH